MALLAPWLADFQLLAAALLLGVMLAIALLRQPAQRLAVAKSTLVALAALALLCAIPGWSLVHLLNAPPTPAPIASPVPLADIPAFAPTSTPLPFEPVAAAPSPVVTAIEAPPTPPPAEPINWPAAIVTLYAAGCALVTLWLAIGALLARRVLSQATPAPPELEQLLTQITGPVARPPQLLISSRIAAPVAMGLRRPAIILPLPRREGLGEGFATPQFQVAPQLLPILAHEWAHLQHRDLHILAATRLLLILLWPQPLFWLLRRTIRLDQETLADAAAADRAGRLDYAQQLLAWARTANTQRPPRLAGAVGLWEGPSQLKRRIAVLLNDQFEVMRTCSRRWRWLSVSCIAALVAALSLVTLQPVTDAAEDEAAIASATSPEVVVARKNELLRGIVREKNSVRGYCVDEHGEPLAGAKISLFDYRSSDHAGRPYVFRETLSDKRGYFHIDAAIDVEQAKLDGIPVDKPFDSANGWAPISIAAQSPGRAASYDNIPTVLLVQDGDLRMFELRPGKSLSGRITDDAGRPVAGAQVTAGWNVLSSTTTDANGDYEIRDLYPADGTPGHQLFPVKVVHPDFALSNAGPATVPGKLDVTLQPAGAIEGRVEIQNGEGKRPAAVAAPASSTRQAKEIAERGSALVKQLALAPNVFIGYCVDESNHPLPGVEVSLYVHTAFAKENVEPIARVQTGADGRFEFNQPVDVAKEFPNGVPADGFVKSPVKFITAVAKAPGRATKFQNDALYRFVKHGQAAILRMAPSSTLTGRVTDENGVPLANAIVATNDNSAYIPNESLRMRTDAAGRFAIDDLASFDADAAAREHLAARDRGEHTVMYPVPRILLSVEHPGFANKLVRVKNIPGELEIALAPGATITGRVVAQGADPNEPPRPVANAHVVITRTRQPKLSADPVFVHREEQRGVTDADGNYSFTSLPASEYAVTATAPNLTTVGVRGIGAPAGQTVTAPDVVLRPGGIVRVRLVDGKTNEPLKLKVGQKGYIHPRRNPSAFYVPDSPSGPETVEPPLIDSPIVAFTADAVGETRLPPGKYSLFVSIPEEDSDYSSVSADGQANEEEFEVREGETIERTVPMLVTIPAAAGVTATFQSTNQPADGDAKSEQTKTDAVDGALHFTPIITPADSNDEGASLPANVIEIDGQQVILGDPVPEAELRERGVDPAVEPSGKQPQVAPPQTLYQAASPMPALAPATAPYRPVTGQGIYAVAPFTAQTPGTKNANKLQIRALDAQGAPLVGVKASIYRISRLEPAAPRLDRTVATDADGKLLIDKLVSPAEVEHFQNLQAQGAFHQGAVEGGFVIALRQPGFATAQVFQSAGPLALYGATRTVKMRPAVKLSGRVTDPDGEPLPGAKVVAGDFLYAIEGIDAVETDAEGRYEFNDRAAFNRAESNNNEVRFATAVNMYGEPQAPGNNFSEDPSARLVSNLVASHPDYAVTRVAGGNVPGVADIQLNPVAPVTGRVVHHDSGAPAAGVNVQLEGWYGVKATTPDGMLSSTGHWATAKTDADGHYRFPNLPPGVYSVWADSGIQRSQAPWVAREQGGIKAVAGVKPTVAPNLVIGPPGVIKVQLVDGETGQPLQLPRGAVAQPSPLPLSDGIERHQPFHSQVLPATADGVFETKMIPGQFRMLVFVNKSYTDPRVIWQTDDDIDSAGEIFDLQPGETISATIKVLPTARIDEMRARYNSATEQMTQGKYAEAIASLSGMIADFPKSKLRILEQRGQAYKQAGDYSSAIADFEDILQVAPDNATIAYTLAGLLAVSPVDADRDSRRALELASRVKAVAERGHSSEAWLASILEIEAAAHADLGDFKKAISVQEEAIKLAPAARRKELRDRLELYRAGKPFRLQATPAAPPKAPAAQGASTSSRPAPLSTKPVETPPVAHYEERLPVASPQTLLQATEQRASLTPAAARQRTAPNFNAYWNDVPDSPWKLVPVTQGNQVVAPVTQQTLFASTNIVPADRVNARFEAADGQMIPLPGRTLDLVQLGSRPLASVVDPEASIRDATQHVPATPSESILTGTLNNNQVQLTPVRATPPASIEKVDLIKRQSANEPLSYPMGGLEPKPATLEFKSATLGDAVK